MSKLDDIRNELVMKVDYLGTSLHPRNYFELGWGAAMERVKPLVESLEWMSAISISKPERCPSLKTIGLEAQAALAKFYGDTQSDEVGVSTKL